MFLHLCILTEGKRFKEQKNLPIFFFYITILRETQFGLHSLWHLRRHLKDLVED